MEAKDISQLSAAELEQLLAEKKKEERAKQLKSENDYKKERDEFVQTTVALFVDMSIKLKELKTDVLDRANLLHKRMYEVFEKEEKPLKQFSLITECGNYKLVVECSERATLDETGEVAIETIKEVFKRKFENRNKSMYNIIETILMKNNKGDYDERLIHKLRKHEPDINDPDFTKALEQLSKAYRTQQSATYCRAYKLNLSNNKWEDIPMQFSSL